MTNQELVEQILAAALQLQVNLTPVPVGPRIYKVAAGGSVQKALDLAAVKDEDAVIAVEPGTYEAITLRQRSPQATGRITIAGVNAVLLAVGQKSGVETEPYANYYTLTGCAPVSGDPSYASAAVGSPTETDPTKCPTGLVFDSCLFNADPVRGGKRGLAANCGDLRVTNSRFSGYWWQDDSQAIGGYNGPGPYYIENNYLEASGENFIFGGATTMTPAMTPHGVIFRRNVVTKPLAWRGKVGATVKNAFELKCCYDALVEYNLFENCWKSGQDGNLFLITPRNQNGSVPFAQVANVNVQYNVLRHAGGGISIIGNDNEYPSQRTMNLRFAHNLMYDIDPKVWGGSGRLVSITRGPQNVEFDHNTCLGTNVNSFLTLDGPTKADNLRVTNNILTEGAYGIIGGGAAPGQPTWDAWTENSTFDGNILQRTQTDRTMKYPGTNVKTALGAPVVDAQFNSLTPGKGCDTATLVAGLASPL